MTFLKLRKLKKFDFDLEEHIKDRVIFTYYSESKQVETLISNMHIQHIVNAVKKIDDEFDSRTFFSRGNWNKSPLIGKKW